LKTQISLKQTADFSNSVQTQHFTESVVETFAAEIPYRLQTAVCSFIIICLSRDVSHSVTTISGERRNYWLQGVGAHYRTLKAWELKRQPRKIEGH